MTESPTLLRIDGQVQAPANFSFADLCEVAEGHQIADVSALVPNRHGATVRLQGLLDQVQPDSGAQFIGFHAARDNFHASVPLEAVRERAIVIYAREGRPLDAGEGGPVRIFIPDHAACQSDDVDECANVKFVDHIELTAERGFDNRPQDEDEHAKLHEREGGEH